MREKRLQESQQILVGLGNNVLIISEVLVRLSVMV